jgi:hypothetical protein
MKKCKKNHSLHFSTPVLRGYQNDYKDIWSTTIIYISFNFYSFFFMFRNVKAAITTIITRRNFSKSGPTKELYEYMTSIQFLDTSNIPHKVQ